MKKLLVGIITGFFLLGMVGAVQASTLAFDDHPASTGRFDTTGLLSSYNGFEFSRTPSGYPIVQQLLPGTVWFDTGFSGYAHSGDNAVFMQNGGSAFITKSDGGKFEFESLNAKIQEPNFYIEGSTTITVSGFFNGNLVGTDSFDLPETWGLISSNMGAIDELEIYCVDHFFFDTLTLTSPVPVSSAFWLFSSGLIGLVRFARRKTNA